MKALALIMRRGEPTLFAFEGVMRAGIRSMLCLKGWEWGSADKAAEDVVEGAFSRIGAVRPTWKAGQPEWTQDGVVYVPRTRCVNCGKTLPEGSRKYCGKECYNAYMNYDYWRFRRQELAVERELNGAGP